MKETSVNGEMITVNKEEYENLKKLADRLINDKKEMEAEFKEIISNIVKEVESREQLGDLLSKQEFESFRQNGLTPETIIHTMKEQEDTIKGLEQKLKRLENSKLGKIQKKIWEMRKK